MLKLKPLRDNIIIMPDEAATKTKEGIALPKAQFRELRLKEGKILAVGPGDLLDNGKYRALNYKVGDKAVYHEDAGIGYLEDGITYQILNDADVRGIIE